MIRTFKDKETEKVYNQIFSRKLPNSIQKTALRKLIMIDNAEALEDLKKRRTIGTAQHPY